MRLGGEAKSLFGNMEAQHCLEEAESLVEEKRDKERDGRLKF